MRFNFLNRWKKYIAEQRIVLTAGALILGLAGAILGFGVNKLLKEKIP
ncbi:MAG: hypothetical protein LBD41_04235 [Clostridiales Family XIII bacterium]|jgi:hypothetical protein|nr:hypothetical protein [Clostridiales Family XIII bacterium]